MDLMLGNTFFSWRSWRLGGDFLKVLCLASPDHRVLARERKMAIVKSPNFTADFADFD